MMSWLRATPRESVGRSRNSSVARRTTLAAAGSREGWPSGYMACLWSAIESSMRNSPNSRDSAARFGGADGGGGAGEGGGGGRGAGGVTGASLARPAHGSSHG